MCAVLCVPVCPLRYTRTADFCCFVFFLLVCLVVSFCVLCCVFDIYMGRVPHSAPFRTGKMGRDARSWVQTRGIDVWCSSCWFVWLSLSVCCVFDVSEGGGGLPMQCPARHAAIRLIPFSWWPTADARSGQSERRICFHPGRSNWSSACFEIVRGSNRLVPPRLTWVDFRTAHVVFILTCD